MNVHHTRRLAIAGAATAATVLALGFVVARPALAGTLFSDTFESGSSAAWSRSGGTWSVVADGSRVLRQSGTSADASARAGSSSWTNYTVSARVKPITFGGTTRYVALTARARSSSTYYYLALTGAGTAVLGKRVSGTSTALATAAAGVAPGSWYTLTLTVSGTTLAGAVAGGPALTAVDGQISSGQAGFATGYAAGEIDDVVVSDAAGPGPTTTPPPTTQPPSSPPPTSPSPTTRPPTGPPPAGCGAVPAGEEGWATVAGATTGGACGPTVTVTSLAQLQAEANRKGTAETILVDGLFTGSGEITVRDNKSIIGVGANSGLAGIGLSIEHLHPANVIVRNMTISKVTASSGDGDAIHIQDADHIWIDHDTLSSDLDHGTDYYDGLLDATHGSDYITASWNHLATHIKDSLLGHDDDNAAEDTGHLRVTYHHNWFDRTMERNPRVRFGDPVHLYDNYYSNITGSTAYYGVASTQNAGVLVEDNVFENVQQACWSASGYADSGPGRLVARDNQLINSGPCETNGSVAAVPYAYHLEDAGTVKASVTAGAGAGHP